MLRHDYPVVRPARGGKGFAFSLGWYDEMEELDKEELLKERKQGFKNFIEKKSKRRGKR